VLDNTVVLDQHLTVYAHTTAPSAACPVCAVSATRVRSRYWRQFHDRPLGAYQVTFALFLRRFACDNTACPRRIFCERVPAFGAAYCHRTTPVHAVLRDIAFALGGRAGARLAAQQHTPVSRTTLLRLIRTTPLPIVPAPTRIGVDDFAFRKGRVYGTIIIDLDTHRPIDVLEDRSRAVFAAWLKDHPNLTIISRDRASAYADAAQEHASTATQVADRFHMLVNLRETVARFFVRKKAYEVSVPLEIALPPAADGALSTVPAIKDLKRVRPKPPTQDERERTERRERRLARFEQVRALYTQGLSMQQIARTTKIHKMTVAKYVKAERFPETHPHPKPTRLLDPDEDYIRQRWLAEQPTVGHLYTEIRAQGYTGSAATLQHFLAPLRPRKQWGSGDPNNRPRLAPHLLPDAVRHKKITIQGATWAVLLPEDKLSAYAQRVLKRLQEWDADVKIVYDLVHGFRRLIHKEGDTTLDDWLTRATESGIAELGSFANGLRLDKAAVDAGLTLDVSHGMTEGHVNRVKMLKRQMYGRATLDLLKARVLAA